MMVKIGKLMEAEVATRLKSVKEVQVHTMLELRIRIVCQDCSKPRLQGPGLSEKEKGKSFR